MMDGNLTARGRIFELADGGRFVESRLGRSEGKLLILMVGAEGFEPPTLCSQSRCATRLRYAPTG